MNDLDALARDALRVRLLRRMGHAVQHDLKSPVQGVSWSLDLAQRAIARAGVDDATREQVQKALTMARKELARLERNARDLLTDAGVAEDEEASCDIADLARELARHFVTEAAMRDLQLVVAVPDECVIVQGSRSEVAPALLACLVNTFDGLGVGGRAEIVVRTEGDYARIEIVDDGPEPAGAGEYSLATLGRRLTDQAVRSCGGEVRCEVRESPWRRVTCLSLPLAPVTRRAEVALGAAAQ